MHLTHTWALVPLASEGPYRGPASWPSLTGPLLPPCGRLHGLGLSVRDGQEGVRTQPGFLALLER